MSDNQVCSPKKDDISAFMFSLFLVAINITYSYQTDPHPCSGIPEITETQLVVELIADPCPSAEWYLNGVPITAETENITVSECIGKLRLASFNKVVIYILHDVILEI